MTRWHHLGVTYTYTAKNRHSYWVMFCLIFQNPLGMCPGDIFMSILSVDLFSLFNKLGMMMHMGYIKGLKSFLRCSNTRNYSQYI